MDYSNIFAISAGGMTLERTRVEVAALNLANANTVAAPGTTPYRSLRVLAQATFGDAVSQGLAAATVQVEPTQQEPRMVYEPAHPMANPQGFVTYAGVDTVTEMVTLMSATRSYEANVAAMNSTRNLALKALDIGGNS
ncbi:flagellar basal body rod protein FlgC [Xylophilus sp. ASV27]|uniref:flagellar basal body rod protein FlgC n=1 Tax=Xylophilus sp. ASV27 TaxID=2795129 RepID=UPI0018EAA5A2|nr:flagellar basal body rod protein FlgC [Xylophilus sp. ASV27]